MAQIIYQIVTGTPNFTASILPAVAADQVHVALGTYSFDSIPAGSYILTIVDSNGCSFTTEVTISDPDTSCELDGTISCITTTSTTTVNNCILDGTIDCYVTTTTTSTTEGTTTTTTTQEPSTTTTTTTEELSTTTTTTTEELTTTTTTTSA